MAKRDLTDPSYLDRLGYESACAGADTVRRRIAREVVVTSLSPCQTPT